VYVTRHNHSNAETLSEIITDTVPDLLIPTHLFVDKMCLFKLTGTEQCLQ